MIYQIPQHTIFKVPFYVQAGVNDRTAVTGITANTMPVYVKKNDKGIAPASGGSGYAETNQGLGLYTLELVAADTDTVGPLVVLVDASGGSGFVHLIETQVVPNPYATQCSFLAGSAGSLAVSGLLMSDDDDHWSGGFLRFVSGALKGQQRRITGSVETIPFLNGASYDDTGNASGEHLIYLPGAFANYTWASGDKIVLTSGAGITPGTYSIASKVSDDAILLASSAGTDSSADVVSEGVTVLTVLGGMTSAPSVGDHAVVIAE